MFWEIWRCWLAAASASPGADWWVQTFGEPGARTSVMDLLAFLGQTVYPADGVWRVLDVDLLIRRVSDLYPPAWGDILQIVVGGLVTTFSIMIILSITTWLLGKVAPRLAPAGKGGERKKDGPKAAAKGEDK
jgi:hypothetical protein